MINVQIIPILRDNYTYLIRSENGLTAIIDPGEANPVIDVLEAQGLTLDYILNTHHHGDHTDGNTALKGKYNAQIVAPAKEARAIKDVDIALHEGDRFEFGDDSAHIIETPGHTAGGICFYFKQSGIVFTGDTLFSLGCGRLFEGTAQDMFASFQKLRALPDDTKVYCGHEYTRGNAGFCLSQDRENPALKARIEQVKDLRANNQPTLPTTIELEKETNIFMKAKSAEEFSALRQKKDSF
ncbi:MAG: hydroxyacylglutathione hydrolase [Flavobacteriaceae bacterium]|nr:hydroxyacylglutathione hydrolase [Flavobacteriaceae bacterium]